MTTPAAVISGIAARVKEARLRRGWSRAELARRAGVSPAMLRNFERTGHIGWVRFVALVGALGSLSDFAYLLPPPPARSLDEMEQRSAAPKRQRGRTLGRRPDQIPGGVVEGRRRAR